MQLKKLFLPLFICLVLFTQVSKAQLSVIFKNKTAYTSVEVDSTGRIKLDSIPRTITLNFPGEDPQNFILKFNKDSSVFSVGFGCSGDSCIKLQLNDVVENKITLVFNKDGELTDINERHIKKPRKVLLDKNKKPYIVIEGGIKAEAPPKKIGNPLDSFGKVKQEVMPVDEIFLDTFKLRCESILCSTCKERKANIPDCCPEIVGGNLDRVFPEPCTGPNKFGSSAKYEVIIDKRPGAARPVTYVKYKKKRNGGYEYYRIKKMPHFVAGSEVVFRVIGLKDTTYVINTDTVQNFMEYEKDFSDVIKNFKQEGGDSVKSDSATTTESPNGLKNDNLQEIVVIGFFTKPKHNIDTLLTKYDKDLLLTEKLKLFGQYYSKSIFNVQFNAFISKQGNTVKLPITAILDNIVKNESALREKSDIIAEQKKEIAENKKLIDSLEDENDSLWRANEELLAKIASFPSTQLLKSKFKVIEMALLKFNTESISNGLLEDQRAAFLLCLKIYINKALGLAVPDSPEEFAKQLQNLAASRIDKNYYTDFNNLISQIKTEYNKAISNKQKFTQFTTQVKVPNADNVTYTVKTPGGTEIFKREFNTSLGFKIDFSTGFFVSGITNSDFLVIPEAFRFKETKDSISTANGQLITTYTGRLIDTAGKIIRENKKLTFNTGFIVHAYTRSGTFANVGLAVGTLINESQIQFLLGGSLLFSVGKQRLALTGGCTFGKQKTLNEDLAGSFISKDENKGNYIYNHKNELPRFYAGDGNINSSTYMKSVKTWFIGITYNFASINIGK